jgi:hypothetical protein
MLRGIYKEFITVKIKDNPAYDEAIFILKNPKPQENNKKGVKGNNALLFEANRILCEQSIVKPKKRFKLLKKLLFSSILLILGGISGAVITFFILY